MNLLASGLTRYLSEPDLMNIRATRVGIAGAGGLGSNCAWMLARSGFADFVIVDHDVVEPSNLNRQFFFQSQAGQPKVLALRENLLRINPDAKVKMLHERVTEQNAATLFGCCQVVVEAFDGAADKKMLVEALLGRGIFLVAASGLGGCGRPDAIITRRVGKNFYMVGDFVTEAGPENPPLAPRVTLTAAKQADLVLAHVLGRLE